jgi:hypothetical protein
MMLAYKERDIDRDFKSIRFTAPIRSRWQRRQVTVNRGNSCADKTAGRGKRARWYSVSSTELVARRKIPHKRRIRVRKGHRGGRRECKREKAVH